MDLRVQLRQNLLITRPHTPKAAGIFSNIIMLCSAGCRETIQKPVSPFVLGKKFRTQHTSTLLHLYLLGMYPVPWSKLQRAAKDVCVCSGPKSFIANLQHGIHVSRSKDVFDKVFVVSSTPHVVWWIGEHQIYGCYKSLTVLKLLLHDRHTEINAMEAAERANYFL